MKHEVLAQSMAVSCNELQGLRDLGSNRKMPSLRYRSERRGRDGEREMRLMRIDLERE